MPKLPRVGAERVVRALKRAGWQVERQRGSHLRLWHPDRRALVTVPMHRGDMRTGTLSSILDQAGLTPDEFGDLL